MCLFFLAICDIQKIISHRITSHNEEMDIIDDIKTKFDSTSYGMEVDEPVSIVTIDDAMDVTETRSQSEIECITTDPVYENQQCKEVIWKIFEVYWKPVDDPKQIPSVYNELPNIPKYLELIDNKFEWIKITEMILNERIIQISTLQSTEDKINDFITLRSDGYVLQYLFECYFRADVQREAYKNSPTSVFATLCPIFVRQIIDYTILFLKQILSLNSNSENTILGASPLIQLIFNTYHVNGAIEHLMPFITAIINRCYPNLDEIFTPFIYNLVMVMKYLCTNKGDEETHLKFFTRNVQPIEVLSKLVSITLESDPTVRPIADLLGSISAFVPHPCTQMQGREIVKLSLLGPFLSVSVFYDENPKLLLSYDRKIKTQAAGIQMELEKMRRLLFNIFQKLILNVATRSVTLIYLSKILQFNKRREQFSVDERTLARDGFMLNVLAVMQQLSLKIKLDRVDILYPFYPDSLVYITKDTKLKMDQTQYDAFVEKLGD